MDQVFPHGAYAVGGVEQVIDFDASTPTEGPGARSRLGVARLGGLGVRRRSRRANQDRPGQDRVADPACASAGSGGFAVPGRRVRRPDCTAYVDASGSRPRLAWSFRATAVRAATPKAQVPQPSAAQSRPARSGPLVDSASPSLARTAPWRCFTPIRRRRTGRCRADPPDRRLHLADPPRRRSRSPSRQGQAQSLPGGRRERRLQASFWLPVAIDASLDVPPCSERYRRDAYFLVAAGLAGE